jgi:hypothetical protein
MTAPSRATDHPRTRPGLALAAVATAALLLGLVGCTDDSGGMAQSTAATELPVGGGVMIRCGGSAVSDGPAICTTQWLRGKLDASGSPVSYTVADSTGLGD